MLEQQKHSFSTGDIVITTRELRSPRGEEDDLVSIPKGTVGIVTGKSWDAWAHGDPHTRVNFGPYGVKMVRPEWLQALDRPITAPQGEPAPVYLWDVLVQLVQQNRQLEAEVIRLQTALSDLTHAEAPHLERSRSTGV